MKKAFLVLAGLGLALAAFAQGPFICTTEGAKLVYVTTDAKGNESSQTDMEIVKVAGKGDDFTIKQKAQLYIGGAALTKPIETVTTVKGGDVLFDFGGIAIAAEGGGFVLPKNLEVGMELPTGFATEEIKASTFVSTLNGAGAVWSIDPAKFSGYPSFSWAN